MLSASGNLFKCHEEVLYLQPLIPPKRFDIFPHNRGMLRRSRCGLIFLLKQRTRYFVVREEGMGWGGKTLMEA